MKCAPMPAPRPTPKSPLAPAAEAAAAERDEGRPASGTESYESDRAELWSTDAMAPLGMRIEEHEPGRGSAAPDNTAAPKKPPPADVWISREGGPKSEGPPMLDAPSREGSEPRPKSECPTKSGGSSRKESQPPPAKLEARSENRLTVLRGGDKGSGEGKRWSRGRGWGAARLGSASGSGSSLVLVRVWGRGSCKGGF